MDVDSSSTHQKALRINFDRGKQGTFAEIGAGQEVVRWFFRVGGASGTVSKTISAYDMTVSDAIYGPCERYVSRDRLDRMLHYEYDLMVERLDPARGTETQFFAFANTVATHSYSHRGDGHGWMGVRFQHQPGATPSEIILHVRLLDRESAREQEAIGVLGVNLIYSAFFQHADPTALIASLLDCLTYARIEIDLIRFSGPAFVDVDNRLMSLQLVEQGFTDAAMFTADGEVVQAADLLYKQPILIERGSFHPLTTLTESILNNAIVEFQKGPLADRTPPVILMEMTLRQLQMGDMIDHTDFLARVDTLGTLGHTVMISNYMRYHRLMLLLRRLTDEPIAFAMGLRNVRDLFDAKYYTDMPGGILQALGQLFQGPTQLYACPAINHDTGHVERPSEFQAPDPLRHLYSYLLENGHIQTIPVDEALLNIYARDVLSMIERGDPTWETLVPSAAGQRIRERGYFGCAGPAPADVS